MSARYPHSSKGHPRSRSSSNDGDDTRSTENNETPDFFETITEQRERLSLANKVLSPSSTTKILGRPPADEEEKRETYTQLIRLKATGRTNKECAETLGVSARTIDNYRADPLYSELEGILEQDARQHGHQLIGELIYDALDEMYNLLHTSRSDFVRFKAAEGILNYAGYNVPREEARRDNRDEAIKFLQIVEQRTRERLQINVQINQNGQEPLHVSTSNGSQGSELVEGSLRHPDVIMENGRVAGAGEADIPSELAPYYQTVLPGGKIPESFGTGDRPMVPVGQEEE